MKVSLPVAGFRISALTNVQATKTLTLTLTLTRYTELQQHRIKKQRSFQSPIMQHSRHTHGDMTTFAGHVSSSLTINKRPRRSSAMMSPTIRSGFN
jgi:hypothetical protein